MKKDISIIVPIYNAEEYLEKCLDSIVHQTKEELEIILINDGSTDNSESIIKKYKDSRIQYYKNKNQGIGKTRNFGISKATGDYIMFLDSDDYMELDACEKMYEKATHSHLDLVICDFYKVFDNGTVEKVTTPDFKDSTLKANPKIITEYLCPWAKIYRRDFIMDNHILFVEDLKYEDAPFVLEALCCAKKIGKVNECLNAYVIHSKSETTVRDERCFDILKIIDKMRKYTKDKEYLKDVMDRLTVRMITNYTIQQRVQSDKRIAMKFIDEAFKYLEQEVPDYKDNKYYIGRNFLKRVVEKNILFTKIYCYCYRNH